VLDKAGRPRLPPSTFTVWALGSPEAGRPLLPPDRWVRKAFSVSRAALIAGSTAGRPRLPVAFGDLTLGGLLPFLS